MVHKVIDIVIPTCNPDGCLEELLKRLKKQTYPIRRIYVINTRADYFPEELYHTDGVSVTQIDKTEFDHGATRDCGFHMSDAEIVIFMTQDAVPVDSMLIKTLVEPFSEPRVAVSYARQLPRKNCDSVEQYTRAFNYPEQSRLKGIEDVEELGIKTFFCSNVCAAYRRTIYEELGGFTKKTIFNEDMILAGRMVKEGYQIAYVADAKVFHSHNYSGRQQFLRNFDVAVSQVDHPEVFEGIRSESEGIKLVKQTVIHLIRVKKPYLIPDLIYKSGCKFLGYKLGQNYKRIPQWLVKKCTMNPTYWSN